MYRSIQRKSKIKKFAFLLWSTVHLILWCQVPYHQIAHTLSSNIKKRQTMIQPISDIWTPCSDIRNSRLKELSLVSKEGSRGYAVTVQCAEKFWGLWMVVHQKKDLQLTEKCFLLVCSPPLVGYPTPNCGGTLNTFVILGGERRGLPLLAKLRAQKKVSPGWWWWSG